jgi:hypothetical protein
MAGTKRIQRKIKYKVGDVFHVPSLDGGCYLGQVAVDKKQEIGAIFCFFYDGKFRCDQNCAPTELKPSEIISAVLITPEALERQLWKICANSPIPDHPKLKLLPALREKNFVGAVIVGSGLVEKYLDTYFGLVEESFWPDLNYVRRFFLDFDARKASKNLH